MPDIERVDMKLWSMKHARHKYSSVGHYCWGISKIKGSVRALENRNNGKRGAPEYIQNTQGYQRQSMAIAQFI